MIPNVSHYRLTQAHIPACFLQTDDPVLVETARRAGRSPLTGDDLCCVDLEIRDGQIVAIAPTGQLPAPSPVPSPDCQTVDLRYKMVWPCFVDMHTHLDKGHTWERTPNVNRTFESALEAVQHDSATYWQSEDVYRRVTFGLKCSYAHGTSALRTHVDALGEQARISLEVIRQVQQEWRDRLTLQAVCLVSLDYFLTPQGEALADQMTEVEGGFLGGVAFPNEDLDAQLDRVFTLAKERGLALDFHTDESGDPGHITLRQVAQAAIRHGFDRPIVCGHCCSLAVQTLDQVQTTLDWVNRAGIGVVSLPLCNLYLQDRNQVASKNFEQTAIASPQRLKTGNTPRWRGVTLLHELKAKGVPVAIASDNCRDPFHGFGDHDALEVFTMSAKIAHLDAPYGDWPRTITTTPADLMGLPQQGRIGVGLPADLVIFKARVFSELLSRSQRDRLVVRRGVSIDTTLPDYEELDDLIVRR